MLVGGRDLCWTPKPGIVLIMAGLSWTPTDLLVRLMGLDMGVVPDLLPEFGGL